MENHNNIDEQIQNFRDICDEAYKKYKIFADEFNAQEEEGIEIHPDLTNKYKQAAKDLKKTVDNYETFVASCVKNLVDLTNHWTRLGFTQAQIKKFEEERQNSLLQVKNS